MGRSPTTDRVPTTDSLSFPAIGGTAAAAAAAAAAHPAAS